MTHSSSHWFRNGQVFAIRTGFDIFYSVLHTSPNVLSCRSLMPDRGKMPDEYPRPLGPGAQWHREHLACRSHRVSPYAQSSAPLKDFHFTRMSYLVWRSFCSNAVRPAGLTEGLANAGWGCGLGWVGFANFRLCLRAASHSAMQCCHVAIRKSGAYSRSRPMARFSLRLLRTCSVTILLVH